MWPRSTMATRSSLSITAVSTVFASLPHCWILTWRDSASRVLAMPKIWSLSLLQLMRKISAERVWTKVSWFRIFSLSRALGNMLIISEASLGITMRSSRLACAALAAFYKFSFKVLKANSIYFAPVAIWSLRMNCMRALRVLAYTDASLLRAYTATSSTF